MLLTIWLILLLTLVSAIGLTAALTWHKLEELQDEVRESRKALYLSQHWLVEQPPLQTERELNNDRSRNIRRNSNWHLGHSDCGERSGMAAAA